MSVKDVVFSNLNVLGYCASRDAFDYNNEKEFQRVMYHLFMVVDCNVCRERFVHCWPIHSKQDTANFRRVVHSWLKELRTSLKYAVFPAVNMGLLVSPGGRKIYDFLFGFTKFVMFHAMRSEQVYDRSVLAECSAENSVLLEAACNLEKSAFLTNHSKLTDSLNEHKQFSSVFSAQYRSSQSEINRLSVNFSEKIVGIEEYDGEKLPQHIGIDEFVDVVRSHCDRVVCDVETTLARIGTVTRLCTDLTQVCGQLVDKFCSDPERSGDGRSLCLSAPSEPHERLAVADALVDGRLDVFLALQLLADRLRQVAAILARRVEVLDLAPESGVALQRCADRVQTACADSAALDSAMARRLLELQSRADQRDRTPPASASSSAALPDFLLSLLQPPPSSASSTPHSVHSTPPSDQPACDALPSQSVRQQTRQASASACCPPISVAEESSVEQLSVDKGVAVTVSGSDTYTRDLLDNSKEPTQNGFATDTLGGSVARIEHHTGADSGNSCVHNVGSNGLVMTSQEGDVEATVTNWRYGVEPTGPAAPNSRRTTPPPPPPCRHPLPSSVSVASASDGTEHTRAIGGGAHVENLCVAVGKCDAVSSQSDAPAAADTRHTAAAAADDDAQETNSPVEEEGGGGGEENSIVNNNNNNSFVFDFESSLGETDTAWLQCINSSATKHTSATASATTTPLDSSLEALETNLAACTLYDIQLH